MKKSIIVIAFSLFIQPVFSQINFVSDTISSNDKDLEDIRAIYSEDIDNDGDFDLVSTSRGKLALYENLDAQGTFSDAIILQEGLDTYQKLIIRDLDGDGFKDIIYSVSGPTDKLEWFKNQNGTGVFTGPNLILDTIEFIRALVSFDIDNDGDFDIIAASQLGADKIFYFENLDGLGNFGTEHIISNNISTLMNLAHADIDNDGDEYLMSASFADNKFAWYENLGSGNWGNQQSISTTTVSPDNIHPFDFDNDGDLDLLNLSNSGLGWFENLDGQGNFGVNQIISGVSRAGDISTKDTENDGDKDIIIGDRTSSLVGKVIIIENLFIETGNTGFGNPITIHNTSSFITSISVKDLNGDNLKDILFSSRLDEVSWLEHEFFPPFYNLAFNEHIIKKTLAGYTETMTLSNLDEFNGNSLDFITVSDKKISAYFNQNGQDQFGIKTDLIDLGPYGQISSFATSDLDADNDQDIVVTIENQNEIKWFSNSSLTEVNFFEQQNIPNSLVEPWLVLANDLNNDSSNDIVVSSFGDCKIAIYPNNNGLFDTEIILDDFTDQGVVFLDLSDINGDDFIDIVAFSSSDEILVWYENLGSNQYSNSNIISTDLDLITRIFPEDMDNDGDIDITIASSFPRKIIWYENLDGIGSFDTEQIISDIFINQPPSDIHIIDIDNDNLKDVVTASNEMNYELGYFKNINSAESFSDFVNLSDTTIGQFLLDIGDINNDNRLDLVTYSLNGYNILWHKNLGLGFNQIEGTIRLNINDTECNEADSALPNIFVETTNGSDAISSISLASGYYSLFPDQGDYVTSIASALPNYFTINPNFENSSFTSYGNTDIIEFCIESTTLADDLSITITPPVDEPRPGFDTSYQIIYSNIGTTQLSGDITFNFDDSKIQFLNASETLASQTANTLTFNYSNLNPFETRTIDLDFNVFPPPTTNIDDELISTVIINPVAGDETQNDNTFELNQTVIGSYDPNDIQILEGEQVHIDDADEYLHFLIRFQNTGTASAINVRVEHILDDKLDWTTMQLQSLSHDGRVEITDGSDVQFIFNNINLPDQTSDEEGSIGYIAFKIKPQDNVVVGDIISGVADIYFDFNPPIITNTATTTFVDNLGNDSFSLNEISVYPNPTGGLLNIKSNSIIDQIEVFDMLGRKLLNKDFNQTDIEVDLSELEDGVYFVKIQAEQNTEIIKVYKN